MGFVVVRGQAADGKVVDADAADFSGDKPARGGGVKERRLVKPLVRFGASLTPAGGEQDDLPIERALGVSVRAPPA